jgi:hypothetical protein
LPHFSGIFIKLGVEVVQHFRASVALEGAVYYVDMDSGFCVALPDAVSDSPDCPLIEPGHKRHIVTVVFLYHRTKPFSERFCGDSEPFPWVLIPLVVLGPPTV